MFYGLYRRKELLLEIGTEICKIKNIIMKIMGLADKSSKFNAQVTWWGKKFWNKNKQTNKTLKSFKL